MGYIVWRIYDQPFWSGTRTYASFQSTFVIKDLLTCMVRSAFYKFAASPVFTKSSRAGSPVSNKNANAHLHPVSATQNSSTNVASSPAAAKEASISPTSSSASLQEDIMGGGGGITDETETSPSSPVIGLSMTLPSTSQADTPQAESSSPRSNSLGLGFPTVEVEEVEDRTATPTMFVASPSPAPEVAISSRLDDSASSPLSE